MSDALTLCGPRAGSAGQHLVAHTFGWFTHKTIASLCVVFYVYEHVAHAIDLDSWFVCVGLFVGCLCVICALGANICVLFAWWVCCVCGYWGLCVFEPPLQNTRWRPRFTIGRHCLLLDEAHDLLLAAKIRVARGTTYFGMGLCSDESPPASPRFTGFRFQVSHIYIPFIPPVCSWGDSKYDRSPPLQREQHLLDIVNCPGKDGGSVLKTIDKQLLRIGCTRADILSGTGDGGGENEGVAGIHAMLEADNPSYVRRRCLSHIAWRVADSGFQIITKRMTRPHPHALKC